MSNVFAQATRQKLRISTTSGLLSVEQLWDLSLNKLSTLIKNAKAKLQTGVDSELDFLDETKTVDKEAELTFNVLKEIYIIKKSEIDAEKIETQRKINNEKIMNLIYQKQEKELGEKSIEELKGLLQ